MTPASTQIPVSLHEQVSAWIANDICEKSKQELLDLVRAGNTRELRERMAGPLEFGTAGLRGELGAGQSRMNLAVVVRSTAGIAQYLLRTETEVVQRGVVLGHDARRMGREFAEAAASVFAGYGIKTFLFSHPCPTPLVAYAIHRLQAAAGIMVTASHNPPQYNGMKVYWGNGAQIIPPHDTGMAEAIAAMPGAKDCKRLLISVAREQLLLHDIEESLTQEYLDSIATLSVNPATRSDLTIVYTALHGVGNDLALQSLKRVGCRNVHVVESQAQPDGTFPTVMSPNPEDINALTKAFELASEKTADLILANDPDADRLAVAAFDKTGKRYVHLNGNQVGVLFAQYFLEQPQFSSPNSLYVSTIVSSPMLKVMAASYNVLFEEVLPGFKWIANKAMELQEQRGASFVFGYEEAIGYTVGEIVRDKDGISAAALFGELAAHYARHGISVLEKLEALYRRYGLFMSDQHSITIPGLEGASEIAQIMQRLRETPPSTLSGVPVVRWTDYSCQTTYDSDRSQTPCNLPSSNTVSFELAGGSRVTARPSGTEPKIKFYFDICEQIATTEEFASAYERALEALQDLKTDFLKFT